MKLLTLSSILALALSVPVRAQSPVRGLVVRAKQPVVMDGKLTEWGASFATPVNFGHPDWTDRAAIWRYMWDDQNLYIGLECLDTVLFNKAPGQPYNGDGLEFYLDLREGAALGGKDYAANTVHMHLTALSNDQIAPRFQVRPGIPAIAGVTTEGMELAAAKTAQGYSLEFRLPWSKFPGFKPAAGREIGIDCELCNSDGGDRVDRCWVYSSPAAVQSPAVFGRVRLVDAWDPTDSAAYADVLFPHFMARSTPLGEPASLIVGISPDVQPLVRKVEARAGGKRLPMTNLKKIGPGWQRFQACLVGFVAPTDPAVEVRLLGDNDRVLGVRTVPLR